MKLFKRQPDDLALDNEAADWLVELEDPQPDTQDRFLTWLQQSPRHVKAMDAIARTSWALDEKLDPYRRIDVHALLAEAESNVVPIRLGTNVVASALTNEPDPPRRGRRLWLIACTLAVCVGIGWMITVINNSSGGVYEAAIGERREIKLDDGSIVTLNTRSRVQVNFSPGTRDIRLLQGEALFQVAHDKTRPFRVSAGDSTIQAIGTQFSVYRHSGGTTVAVVEGVVQISTSEMADTGSTGVVGPTTENRGPAVAPSPLRLIAGEVAEVVTDGQVMKSVKPDVEKQIAWTKRRELTFNNDPLAYVAEEFNRYNKQQIRVEGETVRDRRITGIFSADHPQSLTLFLESDPTLRIERQGDNVVVHAQ